MLVNLNKYINRYMSKYKYINKYMSKYKNMTKEQNG